eukprot:gb/GEZJ01004282.1/.p1 GENE.gb/GEZJ01004282.1/~~gb/GEZJ01004282.1/.p1  ORF type:complete len:113 (-),score=13.48 gb/GEZJ01004282.1/:470-808(-)
MLLANVLFYSSGSSEVDEINRLDEEFFCGFNMQRVLDGRNNFVWLCCGAGWIFYFSVLFLDNSCRDCTTEAGKSLEMFFILCYEVVYDQLTEFVFNENIFEIWNTLVIVCRR